MKIDFIVINDMHDLGCRQLAAYMRDKGHSVRILALGQFHEVSIENTHDENKGFLREGKFTSIAQKPITDKEIALLEENLRERQADIIGIGTRSFNLPYYKKLVPALRRACPAAFLIAGGAGPTLSPHIPLDAGMDAVIRGEGEYALNELVEALQNGKDWRDGKNIVYRNNGEICTNPLFPLEKNLDNFPFPFSDPDNQYLIDQNRIGSFSEWGDELLPRDGSGHKSFILTARGCIADCSYCHGQFLRRIYRKEHLHAPRIRQHSLNYLFELARRYKDSGSAQIVFWDDYFVFPTNDMIDFFKRYKEEIDLPFIAHFVIDQLARSDELINAIVDAGLSFFALGVQTGDEEFSREVYNRVNHNDNIVRVIEKFTERGVGGFCYLIAGNPLETEATISKTLDLLGRFPKFDPSFKTFTYLRIKELYYTDDVSLIKKFPNIINMKRDFNTFLYQASLYNIRIVMNDEDFYKVKNNKEYRDNPIFLVDLYKKHLESEHKKYLTDALKTLEGKEVYFYGMGQAYKENRAMFNNITAKAIIIDTPHPEIKEYDGIPVRSTYEALKNESDAAIVIFARASNVHTMARNIKKINPNIHNIISSCIL